MAAKRDLGVVVVRAGVGRAELDVGALAQDKTGKGAAGEVVVVGVLDGSWNGRRGVPPRPRASRARFR